MNGDIYMYIYSVYTVGLGLIVPNTILNDCLIV